MSARFSTLLPSLILLEDDYLKDTSTGLPELLWSMEPVN